MLINQGGEPVAVLSTDSSDDGIEQLRRVMVPDQLSRLPR